MSASENQDMTQAYEAGKQMFERGQYRESVEYFTKARNLVERNSQLGGEVQIWLVTAYEAAGERQEALDLCRQLTQHLDRETRKQSRRLLYILEAPKLNLKSEWLTQIPDLAQVSDPDTKSRLGASISAPPRKTAVKDKPPAVSSFELQDNAFIWLALGAIIVLLGGLLWLS